MSTSVNRQARKRRQEKALKEIWSLLHHEEEQRPQVIQQTSFGMLFKMQIAGVTLGSMLFTSFFFPNMGLWTSAEGGFIGFEDETLAFLDVEGFSNTMIASDDGFLEKPMLPTETGDRSTLRDVSYYTVREGDTVSSIAQFFGIDSQTILEINDISNPSRIRVGQDLKIIPVSGYIHSMNSDSPVQAVAELYKVEKAAIARQNGFAEDAVIPRGTEIIVPGGRKIKPPEPVISAPRPTGSGSAGSSATVSRPAPASPSAPGGSIGTAPAGRMVWPSSSPVISQGYRYGHPALDIIYMQGGKRTTGIHATMAGRVVVSQGGWNSGYGNTIVIDHGNGLRTRYAHMSELYVSVGQYVGQGEMIGWMGNTGRVYGATGLHLHFEVLLNNQRVNPYNYLP